MQLVAQRDKSLSESSGNEYPMTGGEEMSDFTDSECDCKVTIANVKSKVTIRHNEYEK